MQRHRLGLLSVRPSVVAAMLALIAEDVERGCGTQVEAAREAAGEKIASATSNPENTWVTACS